MPATFVVDQAATFSAVVLLSCEPKLAFGSDQQDKTRDGVPSGRSRPSVASVTSSAARATRC